MAKNKCTCGKKWYCQLHSKYRLVVYLKDEFKAAYAGQNTAFHSPVAYDHKNPTLIGSKMKERLEKHFNGAIRSMKLFNNQNSSDKTIYYNYTP